MTDELTAMNDLKLVLWRLPLEHLPATGNLAALDVAWEKNPAMLEHLSDGWVVKSHTLTPLADSLLFSLVLEKPIVVPDTLTSLATGAVAGNSITDVTEPVHRVTLDTGPGPLTPPPELLLWEDGTVTWSTPGPSSS
jgi:hypothetical protein